MFRPQKSIGWVSVAVVLSVSACGDAGETASDVGPDAGLADESVGDDIPGDSTLADAPPQPEPSLLDFDLRRAGPFAVGYRAFSHTYASPTDGAARTIKVHLWYPALPTAGGVVERPVYAGLFEDADSVVDAPLAPPVEAAGYPVHVHSHGHLGFAATSSFLMRHFASHGWVAAAPDHTGNTLFDNIDPRPVAIYALRPADISATLDAMAAFPENEALAGRLRLDAVLLSGHSFGAHTCWASAGAAFDRDLLDAGCGEGGGLGPCSDAERAVLEAGLGDARVAAIAPMAGTLRRDLMGPDGHRSVTVPVLALSGSEDPVGAESQYETTGGVDLTWIDLEGGCHQTFALGSCGTLDVDEGFNIINTYVLAFARRHILRDGSDGTLHLLDGTESLSDKVTLKGAQK